MNESTAPRLDRSPFLTIITPTYRRPVGLKMCRASVSGQNGAEHIQHLIVEDAIGKGVDGMYRDLPQQNDAIRGEYVFMLSDDDCLLFPDVVSLARQIAADYDFPECIMVKQFYDGRILPAPGCWQAPPACGFVTLSNWLVRRDVHIETPYGARYEGDFDHIAAIWRRPNVKIVWADVVLSATQRGANFGRAE